MSTIIPKFSQLTPQTHILRKSQKNLRKEGISPSASCANVTLISKDNDKCGAEKIMPAADPMQAVRSAIGTLSKMELRNRYSAEANAHRNMLHRRGKKNAVVHSDLLDFASFLLSVGSIPAHGATLDRINNNDPEYAPGKVRWADKRTQNGNKGDTLLFQYSRTGDHYTTSRLAKLQKVTQNTIRTRYHRGWTDDEIIEGKRAEKAAMPSPAPANNSSLPHRKPKLVRREKTAAEIMLERDADSCRHLREHEGEEYFLATPKEMGMITPDYCSPAWVKETWRSYMRSKLPRWWKQYKPHVRFDDLKPFQQRLIRQIDPSMRYRKTSNY